MSSISYPLINGLRYSFASIECTINGDKFLGFKSINYDDGLKPGVLYGTTPVPLGRTKGKYEAKGDLEVYRLEAQAILDALATGGKYFYEVPFTLTVQYSETDTDPVTTDNIYGVRLEAASASNSEGSDPTAIKFTLSIIQPIVWDGLEGTAPASSYLNR